MRPLAIVAVAVAVATAVSLSAQTFPMPASAVPGSTDAVEATAPFLAPLRIRQTKLTDQNTLTALGLPATFGTWDMAGFDATSRFVFVPAEVTTGAGVFRYDTVNRTFVTLMEGNPLLARTANPIGWSAANDNFSRLDPATTTPWGSVLTGEETTGGRLFEITNPLSNGPFTVVWRSNIPAVAHEGLRFDRDGNLYFVDEDNSGSIYKFVPTVAGDLSQGQTFVLSVDAFFADANAFAGQNWNSTANRLATRFGPATWLPITDAAGAALTTADPFVFVTATGGRSAADEVKGTPYGRPEDLDLNTLASGNQALYVAVTSENRVVSIELVSATTAVVREFCSFDTVNLATGADVNPLQNDPFTAPGAGTVFASPDNIAVDAFGSIYVVEDGEPNGGDIWKCVDADKDGVAEAMGLFLSLGISGSEPTGLQFDPNDPYRCIVNIQHPASGNNALWSIDTDPYRGSNTITNAQLRTGVDAYGPSTGPGEYVKAIGAGQLASFRVVSPDHSLDLQPFALLLQGFSTAGGMPAFLPPLWINPLLGGALVLAGGQVGPFVPALPSGGAVAVIGVPPGLAGLSVMAQGFVLAHDGSLVMTDGHEYVLR